MATYTDSLGFNKGNAAAYPERGRLQLTKLEVRLDFAAITAARSAAGATALANGDVLEVLQIPAKTQVLAAGLDVLTAEGATQTFDLGDGADPDGFLDGVNGNTVAGYSSTQGAVGFVSGKYYDAADTIDIVLVNAADTAVVVVWAIVVDCTTQTSA